MIFSSSDEIDIENAQAIIREIISAGCIVISGHAKKRMIERGYTSHDVEYIILHGGIEKKEFRENTNSWAYTISGNDLSGDSGSVVIALIKRNSAVLITVLS